jgi:aldehyde dehydrogenase
MMATLNREATAARALELSGMVKTYGHFINGEWVESNSGETIDLSNPATGALLARTQPIHHHQERRHQLG